MHLVCDSLGVAGIKGLAFGGAFGTMLLKVASWRMASPVPAADHPRIGPIRRLHAPPAAGF